MSGMKINFKEEDLSLVFKVMSKWKDLIKTIKVDKFKKIEFEQIPVDILQSMGFENIIYDENGNVNASIKGFTFFEIKLAVVSSVEQFIERGSIDLMVTYDRKIKL